MSEVCRFSLQRTHVEENAQTLPQVGVYSLSGPIVGKLVSRFGPRAVCISGAIVARFGQYLIGKSDCQTHSCGLLASSFAPSLTMVYSSYGLVTGFGFGAM